MTSHLETLHPKNIHIWDNSEVQIVHLDEFKSHYSDITGIQHWNIKREMSKDFEI